MDLPAEADTPTETPVVQPEEDAPADQEACLNGWIDAVVRFPFVLDDFQRRAMQHIRDEEHVLVAAHTSAGKTTVAEFAINLHLAAGRRVLYTSPIKALSNQKYGEFRRKARDGFLHCNPEEIGIVTGDVQNCPDGRVIIATTEIVHNNLYADLSYFDDVGAVVFDEVHEVRFPQNCKPRRDVQVALR